MAFIPAQEFGWLLSPGEVNRMAFIPGEGN